MAKKRKSKSKAMACTRAAARRDHFEKGGSAASWSLVAGSGGHRDSKSKAARSKRACRGKGWL